MLARCQFGARDGKCGATLTYPIKGYPWRHNPVRTYAFDLPPDRIELLFEDAERIQKEHPRECLPHEQLWSDTSEKANGITRDRLTGELCYSIAILVEDHSPLVQYALRESSFALHDSSLFKTVTDLIAPYERL
jgi:hypothetical protein